MGAIPPLRYYLERVLRDMGGVSRTGPLSSHPPGARQMWHGEGKTHRDSGLEEQENSPMRTFWTRRPSDVKTCGQALEAPERHALWCGHP